MKPNQPRTIVPTVDLPTPHDHLRYRMECEATDAERRQNQGRFLACDLIPTLLPELPRWLTRLLQRRRKAPQNAKPSPATHS